MFLVRCPSEREIERFLDDARARPLSYGAAGLTHTEGRRGRLDELRAPIGHGVADFERARSALAEWKHFDLSWVQLFPRHASLEIGTNVAVRIHHLGIWSLNGARIVSRAEDETRFGFAYGTLTNHAEHGEELFEVRLDPRSGEVTYRIRAVSWPQAVLATIGYPFVRRLQAKFRRDSAAEMQRAAAAG